MNVIYDAARGAVGPSAVEFSRAAPSRTGDYNSPCSGPRASCTWPPPSGLMRSRTGRTVLLCGEAEGKEERSFLEMFGPAEKADGCACCVVS